MKTAIITCINAENYGARLQAYALARFIRQHGHEAEVIDYEPSYMGFYERMWYNPRLSIKEWVKLLVQYHRRKDSIEKHNRLVEFTAKHIPITERKYRSYDELIAIQPQADLYIAGSDQIWNTLFPTGLDPANYLSFTSGKSRRISYAASYATADIDPKHKESVKQMLSGIDAISVRESSAVKLTDALGMQARQVCDPAFLIDRRQWDEIVEEPVSDDPYLLIYDFEKSDDIKAVALKKARAEGLKIYSVSPRRLNYAHRNFAACSPQAFLSLIKNARCVISNSLHGSIFSMIYGVDFLVVNRKDGLNVRMADMLARYALQDRIVSPTSPTECICRHIDYASVYPKLYADIDASKAWLLGQIDIARKNADC